MFNSYDPMKLVKEMHKVNKEVSVQTGKTNEEDLSEQVEEIEPVLNKEKSSNEHKKKPQRKLKRKIFAFLFIALIICCTAIFIVYREICAMPFERDDYLADTHVFVKATYSTKYHVAKINLTIDEVIEKWQVTFSNGSISEIKLICETDDETVKKEFSFKNILLLEGETINTSTSLDNISLNDFVLIKELLSGKVQMTYPPLINLDSAEREKLKKYYESGSWLMGLMWANALMGGY